MNLRRNWLAHAIISVIAVLSSFELIVVMGAEIVRFTPAHWIVFCLLTFAISRIEWALCDLLVLLGAKSRSHTSS